MRARFIGSAFTLLFALALSGCLVSETPLLDATSGKARPLGDGAYEACPISDDKEEASDCEVYAVSYGADGAYSLVSEHEDETVTLRFRRVGPGSYAVQSSESDGFAYYYGAVEKSVLELTLMNCPDLPAPLRQRLIARGDLSSDDDKYTVCTVHTVRGLTDAAKAYRNGTVSSEDPAIMRMSPAKPKEE